MKVICAVKDLPLDSIVTKITGAKEYVVRDNIIIHGGTPPVIKAQEGTRFLVGISDNYISCVLGDTEMAWNVTEHELLRWLENREILLG